MFKVPLTTILEIIPHGNADKLSVARVYGFQVVVSKDKYKVGDKIILVPIDSVITNQHLEDHLFPKDAKIKLNNHRVRQIRIRGFPSQGMIIDPNDLKAIGIYIDRYNLEDDLSELLGIIKYEPPAPELPSVGRQGAGRHRNPHPNFHQYNGVENVKWFPDLFKEGDEVVIQEKLHGSCVRAGRLPFVANTLWKKIKKFLKLAPNFEFVYGSNMVEISASSTYKGFYGEDIYGKVLKKVGADWKVKNNHVIYGEVIGPGIQAGYEYGHADHWFVLYDVKVFNDDGTWFWMSPEQAESYAKNNGFSFVPVLYTGPFNKSQAESLATGPSVYCPEEKVREGIVIKSKNEYNDLYCSSNKKSVKWINPEYLDNRKNSDNH